MPTSCGSSRSFSTVTPVSNAGHSAPEPTDSPAA